MRTNQELMELYFILSCDMNQKTAATTQTLLTNPHNVNLVDITDYLIAHQEK
jgi:hypothetical protein